MAEKAVYDGQAHATAREARLECGHKRETFQTVIPGKPLYCPTCDSDQKVRVTK